MTKSKNWAQELSKGLVSFEQLKQRNLLSSDTENCFKDVQKNFEVRIPSDLISRLDQDAGLRKQLIPSSQELVFQDQEMVDPIGDEICSPLEGLTHRYNDRVLLKPTYMCAGYCRFCFRRYKVSHAEYNLSKESLKKALDYIATHSEINEVIVTGGDPLTLTDKAIDEIHGQLSTIEHVKLIRYHTRVLTFLPSRITPQLVSNLRKLNKTVWIVGHINHANEFSQETRTAISLLVDNGIPILMQSVLLKDVNDSYEDLAHLFRKALENRVKPYYLHYPDLAKGTEHFRIPLENALALVKKLRGSLSGIGVPTFIVDLPGGKGKVDAFSGIKISEFTWKFESPLDGSWVEISYPKSKHIELERSGDSSY